MTKPSRPWGLPTAALAEDLSDAWATPGPRDLTWLQRPAEEPLDAEEPTAEVDAA